MPTKHKYKKTKYAEYETTLLNIGYCTANSQNKNARVRVNLLRAGEGNWKRVEALFSPGWGPVQFRNRVNMVK